MEGYPNFGKVKPLRMFQKAVAAKKKISNLVSGRKCTEECEGSPTASASSTWEDNKRTDGNI